MDLAGKIDHTLLTPVASGDDIRKLVDEAIRHRFAAVCVNGHHIGDVARKLSSTGIKTCAVIDFPFGASGLAAKAVQATAAVNDGAREIDFVAHLPYLLAGDTKLAAGEFERIVKAARAANPDVVIKVIVESALLLADQPLVCSRIEAACLAAKDSGCDFIKTSTGFHPAGGATVKAVRLIKQFAGSLAVKASSGIGSYEDAYRMIEAGADRFGSSESVAIVKADQSHACWARRTASVKRINC